MKKYPHLNDVFIRKHLRDSLDEIAENRISSIVAPMGYGKTSFIKWCMDELKRRNPSTVVMKQEILNDNPADFWADLRRILSINENLIKRLDKIHFPQNSHEVRIVADIVLETWTLTNEPIYIVFDNLHFMENVPVLSIILILSERLPKNFHFILVSRNRIFSESEILGCGSNLYQMNSEDFKLTDEDLREYVDACELEVSDEQIHKINETCEGWISLIYLKLKDYAQNGVWNDEMLDSTNLMEQLVLKKLSAKKKRFLVINSLTDGFTKEQAEYMWNDEGIDEVLDTLTEDNSFIKKGPDGIYRYHSMLKSCALEHFGALDEDEKKKIFYRLASWQQSQKDYMEAEKNYERAGDYEALLSCVEVDKGKGKGFDPSRKHTIMRWVKNCPKEILKEHPYALLSFMLSSFAARCIPEMRYVSDILVESMKENTTLSEEEKNNIHGEREILSSFIAFNDYTLMNVCQRRALTLLTRTSQVVNRDAAWTFGSPSIVMMYHRSSGDLRRESDSIRDGISGYSQLTDGHGSGADAVFAGEAAYMTGNMVDAEYEYHVALAAAKRKKQYSIILDAEFLLFRINIYRGDYEGCTKIFDRCRELLADIGDYELRNTYDMMESWFIGQFGVPRAIPDWLFDENVDEYVSFQARAQFYIIKNECLIAKGEYARVAATEFEYIPFMEQCNMPLTILYEYLQLAVSHNSMGHTKEARNFVMKAMDLAIPDQIIMPFVEVCDCICDTLRIMDLEGGYKEFARAILRISDGYKESKEKILNAYNDVDESYNLTEREWEVAKLAASRYTNKEIAEELMLSDYTVKNHLKNIFDKVGIKGNDKNKRIILAEKLRLNK